MSDVPNVLLVECDQLNPAVLGCYGGPVDTSNIDRIAHEGTRFTNAACPTPLCSPSRAAISTGRYPHGHGITHNCMRGYVASSTSPTEAGIKRIDETIGKRFHAAGYDTHHYGKWHLEDDHLPYYDDQFTEHREYAQRQSETFRAVRERDESEWLDWYGWALPVSTAPALDAAVESADRSWSEAGHAEFVAKMGRLDLDPARTFDVQVADRTRERIRDRDTPFFVTCSFNYPHDPNVVPDPYYSRYDPAAITLPGPPDRAARFDDEWSRQIVAGLGEPGLREFLRCYYAAVDLVDDQVGRLLDALQTEGILDETIVVFLADHGDMAGEHGMVWKSTTAFYDAVARVPLLVRVPGADGSDILDVPCDLTDILPTVLDAVDQPVPDCVHGESLVPFLAGEADLEASERYAFSERVSGDPLATRHVPDDVESSFMVRGDRWKYVRYPDGGEFLYDLETDPAETTNRIGDSSGADAARERLRGELAAWLDRTDYPGPVPV
jgi:arylsulfatase A-like enzyme